MRMLCQFDMLQYHVSTTLFPNSEGVPCVPSLAAPILNIFVNKSVYVLWCISNVCLMNNYIFPHISVFFVIRGNILNFSQFPGLRPRLHFSSLCIFEPSGNFGWLLKYFPRFYANNRKTGKCVASNYYAIENLIYKIYHIHLA